MLYLTKNRIKEKLKSVRNRFNQRSLTDDQINKYVDFVSYNKKKKRKRTRIEKELYLEMKCDDHHRELVKEYSHVVVAKEKYSKHTIYIKARKSDSLYPAMDMYVSTRLGKSIEEVFEAAEAFNKICSDQCVRGSVEFPTGKVLFANFFKNMAQDDYAFAVPDDKQYGSRYSINHPYGEQNTMQILSKTHGLGYAQLSNTSAAVYKVSDDKIIITTCFPYYYDEKGYERNLTLPDGWEEIGSICCDVWRIEFIDQENFDKGKPLPLNDTEYLHNQPITCQVNPGKWKIKNQHHYISDEEYRKKGEMPIWVELTREM